MNMVIKLARIFRSYGI